MSSQTLIQGLAEVYTSEQKAVPSEQARAIRARLNDAKDGLPTVGTINDLKVLELDIKDAKASSLQALSGNNFLWNDFKATVNDRGNTILVIQALSAIGQRTDLLLGQKQEEAKKYLRNQLVNMNTSDGVRGLFQAISSRAREGGVLDYLRAHEGVFSTSYHEQAPCWQSIKSQFTSHEARTKQAEVRASETEVERLHQEAERLQQEEDVRQSAMRVRALADSISPTTASSPSSPSPDTIRTSSTVRSRSSSPVRRVIAEILTPEQQQLKEAKEREIAAAREREEVAAEYKAAEEKFNELKATIPNRITQLEKAQADCKRELERLAVHKQNYDAAVAVRERLHAAEQKMTTAFNTLDAKAVAFGCTSASRPVADFKANVFTEYTERKAQLDQLEQEITAAIESLRDMRDQNGPFTLQDYRDRSAILAQQDSTRFDSKIPTPEKEQKEMQAAIDRQQIEFEKEHKQITTWKKDIEEKVNERRTAVDTKTDSEAKDIESKAGAALQAKYDNALAGMNKHIQQTRTTLLDQCGISEGFFNKDRTTVNNAVTAMQLATTMVQTLAASNKKEATEEDYRIAYKAAAEKYTKKRFFESEDNYINRIAAIVIMAQMKRLETILQDANLTGFNRGYKILEWYDALERTVRETGISRSQQDALLSPYSKMAEKITTLEAAQMEEIATHSQELTRRRGELTVGLRNIGHDLFIAAEQAQRITLPEVKQAANNVTPVQPPQPDQKEAEAKEPEHPHLAQH